MATTVRVFRATNRASVAAWVPGLVLVVLGAGFLTALTLGSGINPDYDVHGGAISDLGVDPETAALFNASLLAVGLLNAVAAVLLHRAYGQPLLLGVFAASSLGAIGAGLFPLNTGGPPLDLRVDRIRGLQSRSDRVLEAGVGTDARHLDRGRRRGPGVRRPDGRG